MYWCITAAQDKKRSLSLMRAMRAEQFSGYAALKLVDLPKPTYFFPSMAAKFGYLAVI
jgi:hypothetical protein